MGPHQGGSLYHSSITNKSLKTLITINLNSFKIATLPFKNLNCQLKCGNSQWACSWTAWPSCVLTHRLSKLLGHPKHVILSCPCTDFPLISFYSKYPTLFFPFNFGFYFSGNVEERSNSFIWNQEKKFPQNSKLTIPNSKWLGESKCLWNFKTWLQTINQKHLS